MSEVTSVREGTHDEDRPRRQDGDPAPGTGRHAARPAVPDVDPTTDPVTDPVTDPAADPAAVLDRGAQEAAPSTESLAILQDLRRSTISQQVSHRWAQRQGSGLDRLVFGVAGVFVLAFIVWGFAGRDNLAEVSTAALGWVMENTGWIFIGLASLFVTFILWVALGRFGNIPLGQDGERTEYGTVSWVSMMFAAGMGIGLMFYGVAEPLYHYVSPPPGTAEGQTAEAIRTAMATSLFHWTLYPWAMYAVVGLAIAYGTYRLRRRQLISSVFTSLFGTRAVDGAAGRIINILAIFATLFGTAASLGLGALQIGSGLSSTGWVGEPGTPLLVVIVAVLTACFVASAVSGISRGIQWLSNINMVLAVVLALIVFVGGPTLFILNLVPAAIGDFVADLPEMAARTEATGDEALRAWMSSWTIFYWAWWVSWTPFVGMFIAKISRGRTIRQFVIGVLLVPGVVSLFWFCIFGGAAINTQAADRAAGDDSGLARVVDGAPTFSTEGALFDLLGALPLGPVLSAVVAVLAMVLVGIFFVTGADSASLVMGSLSSKGAEHPRRPVVIFWGVLTGAVAAVMLMAGGDEPAEALSGLQRITIVAALPFVLVMLLMCIALVKDLRNDPLVLRRRLAESVVADAIRTGVDEHQGGLFKLVTEHDCPDGDCDSHPDGQGTAPADGRGTAPADGRGTAPADGRGPARP
ncbi:BCCT family transporter [Citricoccus sp. SGAir0253]|uniref:BCCT family transporter n=1 Tax=Citricoccus sp. SGAir0253 TaxID=2567881 RepID=UPI0010CD5A7D|nr:BCCT family transporter [Citricoccus sp. SGAir0253]QCU77266.1 BCCT family transporter [Citricoccus sp. SGAir0253]